MVDQFITFEVRWLASKEDKDSARKRRTAGRCSRPVRVPVGPVWLFPLQPIWLRPLFFSLPGWGESAQPTVEVAQHSHQGCHPSCDSQELELGSNAWFGDAVITSLVTTIANCLVSPWKWTPIVGLLIVYQAEPLNHRMQYLGHLAMDISTCLNQLCIWQSRLENSTV